MTQALGMDSKLGGSRELWANWIQESSPKMILAEIIIQAQILCWDLLNQPEFSLQLAAPREGTILAALHSSDPLSEMEARTAGAYRKETKKHKTPDDPHLQPGGTPTMKG